jgi:hypothetical protein
MYCGGDKVERDAAQGEPAGCGQDQAGLNSRSEGAEQERVVASTASGDGPVRWPDIRLSD